MRGGKPGYFPTFDQLPHPFPFNLFDPFKLSKGASAGSLFNVYVSVVYSDGTRTGGGFIPSEPLADSRALAAYLATSHGSKLSKYMPGSETVEPQEARPIALSA